LNEKNFCQYGELCDFCTPFLKKKTGFPQQEKTPSETQKAKTTKTKTFKY